MIVTSKRSGDIYTPVFDEPEGLRSGSPRRSQYEVRHGRSDTALGRRVGRRARAATAGHNSTLCGPLDGARPGVFAMETIRSARILSRLVKGETEVGGGVGNNGGTADVVTNLPATSNCLLLRGIHAGGVF